MEILLDTHIFLWYINGDKQLSNKYCDLIRDYKIENDIQLFHKLPDIHKDPFDRLLICQALSNDLTLITEDNLVKKYGFKSLNL